MCRRPRLSLSTALMDHNGKRLLVILRGVFKAHSKRQVQGKVSRMAVAICADSCSKLAVILIFGLSSGLTALIMSNPFPVWMSRSFLLYEPRKIYALLILCCSIALSSVCCMDVTKEIKHVSFISLVFVTRFRVTRMGCSGGLRADACPCAGSRSIVEFDIRVHAFMRGDPSEARRSWVTPVKTCIRHTCSRIYRSRLSASFRQLRNEWLFFFKKKRFPWIRFTNVTFSRKRRKPF